MRWGMVTWAVLVASSTAWGEAVSSPPADWRRTLEARVSDATIGFDGELSLYVGDVASGEVLGIDADRRTYLSSAIKVVVALEVLRQVDAGVLSLQERIPFTSDDVRDGVGPLKRPPAGTRFTVARLLELMLVSSDNAAADLLMSVVGVERLNTQLAWRGVRFGPLVTLFEERQRIYGRLDPRATTLGPREIQELGRYDRLGPRAEALSEMLGHAPAWTAGDLAGAFRGFYEEGVNSAPMREMGRLLMQVARCEGLSPDSCARLKELMKACETGRGRLRAGLPDEVVWAHKTGTQYQRACDVGLLQLAPGREVVIAACARDFRHVADAEAVMALVGRAVWDVLGGERTPGGGWAAQE